MSPKHATLGPSGAARWIQCPASVRAIEKVPVTERPETSVYAEEGTAAHALAEIHLRHKFGEITTRQFNGRLKKWTREAEAVWTAESIEDMRLHVETYIALVEERFGLFPNSVIMFEQRVDTGVPQSWGTSDTVIVSPIHVEIIDLKYGAGVPVSAFENPQLMLYGVGALEQFGDLLGEPNTVFVTVCQPRLDSVSTYEITSDELREWRDSIIPIAVSALDGTGEFGPSEKACRWCPAAGVCRARVEKMTAIDFGKQPDLLSLAELGELLEQLPEIRQWVSAVEAAALHQAIQEEASIPGWKAVLSNGQRVVRDKDAAIKRLTEAGIPQDVVTKTSLVGIGELERAVRKQLGDRKAKLEDVLGSLVEKTEGKASLVPEDDPRPAINTNAEAAEVFSANPAVPE